MLQQLDLRLIRCRPLRLVSGKLPNKSRFGLSILRVDFACGPIGMSYYDVLEFMEDTQKLPCSFLFDIPNCGHLEGTAEKHVRRPLRVPAPLTRPDTASQGSNIRAPLLARSDPRRSVRPGSVRRY